MKKQASNTFKDGLIMDYSPSATPNTILTNSLNGTLVTYNGNELMLQNDMGNSCINRVRLDEGYIPTGIAEHGGIIYVASYNPQSGHGQIGSFPYPKVNYYADDFENDVSTNWAFQAYVTEGEEPNKSIQYYEIKNSIDPSFQLPMFIKNTIRIPLLRNKEGEYVKLRNGDSFSNKLTEDFQNFISCEGVKAYYYVSSGGIKHYIDETLDDETREEKIKNGDIIYYTGRYTGELFLELQLTPISKFFLSQNLVEENNNLKIEFISNPDEENIPMYITNLNSVNSNAKEVGNIVNSIAKSFSTIYSNDTEKVNITAYPITENYGIDGTNGRSVSFNPRYLLEQKEILSRYKYKWEDGKLTLDWSYQSILQEDQSAAGNYYTFHHYFFDVKDVYKILDNLNSITDIISYYKSNTINPINPVAKIDGTVKHKSVSTSFTEVLEVPKGLFLHVITTKKGETEKIRVLRFTYATSYMNQFFDNEEITDYIDIFYYLGNKGLLQDGEWVENLNLDIEDQLFKTEVTVQKSKYRERNEEEFKETNVLDPVIMQDIEVSGDNEFTIQPDEFYNEINISISPNTKENQNTVEINLNPTEYEDHIVDSSIINININDIKIQNVYDKPAYSSSNYSKLTSIVNIGANKDGNKVNITRGIYSGSSGDKQLMEKKITGLYPLYQSNYDNSMVEGYQDNTVSVNSLILSEQGLVYGNTPLTNRNEGEEGEQGDGQENLKVFVRDSILRAQIDASELNNNDYNSCFNLICGNINNDKNAQLSIKNGIICVDTKYGTFAGDLYYPQHLAYKGYWQLITARDTSNKMRVLPFGGAPTLPYKKLYGDIDEQQPFKLSSENPKIYWIPANQKLNNLLSQIFTLRSITGTYYIIGADGINTVYSVVDKSYFEYNFGHTVTDYNDKWWILNDRLIHILYKIAAKDSSSNIKRTKLNNKCIPQLYLNNNTSTYYYGNNINLNSSEFNYIINRYNSVYELTWDVLIENDISDEDIYIFDWSKLQDPNLIGTIYKNQKYAGLNLTEIVGLNPKDSSYMFNVKLARSYLIKAEDCKSLIIKNSKEIRVTSLKDWNGYNFFIDDLSTNFMTVFKAKRKFPGVFNIPDNGILLASSLPNGGLFEWSLEDAEDAFSYVSLCLYGHDMRYLKISSLNPILDQNNKKKILLGEHSNYYSMEPINSSVQEKLYKSIENSMINYEKTL